MWILLLACRPSNVSEDGHTVTLEDGRLLLTVDERVVFETSAPLESRTIDEEVTTSLGIWSFERRGQTSTEFSETRIRGDVIELSAEDGSTGTLEIEFAQDHTRFTLATEGADTLAVPVRCDEQGSFHGFGAQYHSTDQRGESFSLFTSEQGIGREEGGLFFFSGDRHTSYFPMPWMLDARGHGVLFETDHRVEVDLCDSDPDHAWFEAISGEPLSWTVFHGPTIPQVLTQLGDAIGRPTAPPSWAFDGVWLMTQGGTAEVESHVAAAQAADVPVSAAWIQDWSGARTNLGGGYGVQYRWEADEVELYPNLRGLTDSLHAQDIKALGYMNPFVDPALQHWDEMEAGGMLPTTPSGEVCTFFGPRGDMTQADLTHPATRDYIKTRLRIAVTEHGLDGWMADFSEWLPLDCELHDGDARAFHNRYPEAWQRLTREVMEELRPDGDWVMFARAGWTGVHDVAQIHWIGDQEADFLPSDGLPTVVPALLNLGLSGQPFVTHDVAGFSGGPSTPELYRRWIELGAFTPIFRMHDGNERDRNHRWDSDADTTAFFSRMARIHAALAPEWAALSEEAARTGMPMLRHLMLHHPEDRETWNLDDQFLLGPDLMVAPVTVEGATGRRVYLPEGTWFHVWTGTSYAGPTWMEVDAPLGMPPVFSRTDRPDLRAF